MELTLRRKRDTDRCFKINKTYKDMIYEINLINRNHLIEFKQRHGQRILITRVDLRTFKSLPSDQEKAREFVLQLWLEEMELEMIGNGTK